MQARGRGGGPGPVNVCDKIVLFENYCQDFLMQQLWKKVSSQVTLVAFSTLCLMVRKNCKNRRLSHRLFPVKGGRVASLIIEGVSSLQITCKLQGGGGPKSRKIANVIY